MFLNHMRTTRNRQTHNGIIKNSTNKKSRLSLKTLSFKDYPDFRPNLTPRDIFEMGSFGGTYWRPIYSSITKKKYKNIHKKYPTSWWKGIPEESLSGTKCDITKNRYKVRVGTSLDLWEKKKWIHKDSPYGWVQWYCDFYNGKRGPDDRRQVDRWKRFAGPKGRFSTRLKNMVKTKKTSKNDYSVSPKIRQSLQHWAYRIDR